MVVVPPSLCLKQGSIYIIQLIYVYKEGIYMANSSVFRLSKFKFDYSYWETTSKASMCPQDQLSVSRSYWAERTAAGQTFVTRLTDHLTAPHEEINTGPLSRNTCHFSRILSHHTWLQSAYSVYSTVLIDSILTSSGIVLPFTWKIVSILAYWVHLLERTTYFIKFLIQSVYPRPHVQVTKKACYWSIPVSDCKPTSSPHRLQHLMQA